MSSSPVYPSNDASTPPDPKKRNPPPTRLPDFASGLSRAKKNSDQTTTPRKELAFDEKALIDFTSRVARLEGLMESILDGMRMGTVHRERLDMKVAELRTDWQLEIEGEGKIKVNQARRDLEIVRRQVHRTELGIVELRTMAKTTIKAVEKLAKGKSLGALGLPMEEEWDRTL